MDGIDGIIFTANIGEYSVPIRAHVLRRPIWPGFELADAANTHHRQPPGGLRHPNQ